jgi:hypothetical protein
MSQAVIGEFWSESIVETQSALLLSVNHADFMMARDSMPGGRATFLAVPDMYAS